MIIDKFVTVDITARNITRYKNLGYDCTINRPISILVEHLSPGSKLKIEIRCDMCKNIFQRTYGSKIKYFDLCNECIHTHKIVETRNSGNGYKNSNSSKGKSRPQQSGSLNGRWNPNKSHYQIYNGIVRKLTKRNSNIWSKWKNANKLGKMGTENAYQLDHKISIKYGYDNHITPELIADVKNLQIIPWEENRNKSSKNSIDLWDLLN